MAPSLSLSLNPPFSPFHRNRRVSSPPPLPFSAPSPFVRLHINSAHHRVLFLSASAAPDNPNHSLDESRWLREEQRWLREEQRWLREERRWSRERDSLLAEIAQLQIQLQALQRQGPIEIVKEEKGLIADSGSIGSPLVLGEGKGVEERVVAEEKEIRVVEEAKIPDRRKSSGGRTLRVGAEGDEVKAMQEALQKLGFYSGEEDTEYSSFSSGTERAVKTWQSSIGVKEDGIMTAELLEILYFGRAQDSNSFTKSDEKGGANGAPFTSVEEVVTYEQIITKGSVVDEEASSHRVFLLGENRWEEPSRLIGRDKQNVKTKSGKSTTKCLVCRGEGRLMCTECDGSGEPNIEPQFMEWIDEGMKCPYCEGLGYTTCDACEGKAMV